MLLYIDDGASIFESRQSLEEASNIIYDTWKTIGLTIHTGQQHQKSKTEAIFPPYANGKMGTCYENADKAKEISVDSDKFVEFTKNFHLPWLNTHL